MESFNVGAVVFVLLIGLWLVYAMPTIAERRRILAEAERVSAQRHSTSARDLTNAARNHSRQREVESMRDNGQILRPADPTSRPRFELPESEADLGARIIAPTPRMNRAVAAILLALVVLTVALLVLAALSMVTVWAPVASCGALVLFLVVHSLVKNTRAKTAQKTVTQPSATTSTDHANNSLHETESGAKHSTTPTDAAETAVTPVPAPRGSHSVTGVTNPAERHEAFLRHVLDTRAPGESAHYSASGRESFRYGALSSQSRLEDAALEEREAVEETHGRFLSAERPEIGGGLTVDEILERRRA